MGRCERGAGADGLTEAAGARTAAECAMSSAIFNVTDPFLGKLKYNSTLG